MPDRTVPSVPDLQGGIPVTGETAAPSSTTVGLPLRAAFYYPWFPEAWNQQGMNPFTKFHPTAGFYSLDTAGAVDAQIQAMQYGNIQAGIASWWGQGSQTDLRLPALLAAAGPRAFYWSVYYEAEGNSDPSVAQIQADLAYLRDRYTSQATFLKLGGRFVVFVYAGGTDGCGMATRWKQANQSVGAYVVLKVFPGYAACADQPDNWHQYGPASAADGQGSHSYAISPGFWLATSAGPRLGRDLTRWAQNVRDMIASGADFQLVTTFNEWGEGTAVESASEWASPSGYGAYLDVLHNNGGVNGLLAARAFLPLVQSWPPGAPTPTVTRTPSRTATASNTPLPTGSPTQPPQPGSVVLVGAGDIATCSQAGAEATAKLLDAIPGTVFTAGDNAYPDGTAAEFANCYGPTWGRHKARTFPTPGNHEYHTSNASGYFGYFGAAAGAPGKGYYSYDLGSWHIIALNSECDQIGGCGAGSPQLAWLKADLQAHPAVCTLAYWHKPLFSSGMHGNNPEVVELFRALYDAGADVVLNGHDHEYERFAPMAPDGKLDLARGIREFVVGMGGSDPRDLPGAPIANSEKVITRNFGVIKLTLRDGAYDWQFVSVAGKTGTDSGSAACH